MTLGSFDNKRLVKTRAEQFNLIQIRKKSHNQKTGKYIKI